MPTKWTLNTAAMQEEFFTDAALIGISSALPAYQFCWMLNSKFDMKFVREPEMDICIQGKDGKQHYYALYQYCAPLNGARYLLYKLKSEKHRLLPEMKNLDYLWLIQSTMPGQHAQTVTTHLREMPEVAMAQLIEPDKIKSLSNLLV